ncbi:MAG: adenylosuccinate lyase [Legionellales bacterium RIFCSPHIGHO2_12_FULL_42_9]|nr:MAG: adenylosuccinate lyase [Legionellales bacterium RIFCSPHIGHO2_12_FULL_42_9]
MNTFTLMALSPLDGRYVSKTATLSHYFSEYAFFYYRLLVEIRWFESLANNHDIQELPPLNDAGTAYLDAILQTFNVAEAAQIKIFENQTNHDVKAIEYYLHAKFDNCSQLRPYKAFVHFACTSEDINNLAYALMLQQALIQEIQPILNKLIANITILARKTSDNAMLSRTHGQPATPTTMGKELINFVARLKRPLHQLNSILLPAKFNGAVGNYNAHIAAYPEINWRRHCANFVESFGLNFNEYTTQIEPHDGIAELSQIMSRINNILLDYTQDTWIYIALNYFTQTTVTQEVGSSTMPHKVNPIDFENAEGNLGIANALYNHFANKLTRSRLQRDLSDSSVLRNLGVAFGHSLIAYKSLLQGISKLQLNCQALDNDLTTNWGIVAEAIQTVMRRYQIPDAYEKLKALTRGQIIRPELLMQFIQTLDIPDHAKEYLLQLRPEKYLGLASQLVQVFEHE